MIPKPDSCRACPLYGSGHGFVPASGTGANGVLMILEAAGEGEAAAGVPVVGKAGQALFSQLQRVGIGRDDFRIHNVLSCRPPNNKLAGEPYEPQATACCSPNLAKTIWDHVAFCRTAGKTPVLLVMGRTAFKRVMNLDERVNARLLKADYLNYPFWSEAYKSWVVATDHPSYVMRGNHHLWPVLTFGVQRALEIAQHGLTLDEPDYLLDPALHELRSWLDGYYRVYQADPTTVLSYDIETPMKQGEDEEVVSKEEDDDYTILRCSFSYRPGHAVSVPWNAEFMSTFQEIFAHPGAKLGWNSDNYDFPRVLRAVGTIHGDQLDGMLAWHVVNSTMPKGLGFVTPFYVQNTSMWKHLSDASPAFYNAKDADMALQNWLGIKRDLVANNQMPVFTRHVIEVNRAFAHMRESGVLFDGELRAEAESKVSTILNEIDVKIESVVPLEARQLQVYKKVPKSIDGLVPVVGERKSKQCPTCSVRDVKATHFKSIGKKRLKLGEPENPCHGSTAIAATVTDTLYARVLPFKLSAKQLLAYQAVKHQKPVWNRKENKITFDEDAINRLQSKYKNDLLYPLIGERRVPAKLLSTYIGRTQEGGWVKGGMPVGPDGRIHTLFTHNPSTLRSASQKPNLQNIPRPGKKDDLATYIRNFFVAAPGHVLHARDYSGIEAVLVGYFAQSPRYIRLAKMDVHSYYTAYALHQLDGRVSANDLPDVSWDDTRLNQRLSEIKKEFKEERNNLFKHLVHGNNFMQGVAGSQRKIYLETGKEPDFGTVKKVMGVYFELFPEIQTWHHRLMLQASDEGYLRNPFGYVHRFNRVYEWEKEPDGWTKKPGPQANEVIAFLPQSTAAAIIKEAMLRIYQNHFDSVGRYLRLLVHDELFFEIPLNELDAASTIIQYEMEKAIPELPLPASYEMGPFLNILTEAKEGQRWGEMH